MRRAVRTALALVVAAALSGCAGMNPDARKMLQEPIPALLDEANRAGKLGPGDLCCTAGFGPGFTWGSALLRW